MTCVVTRDAFDTPTMLTKLGVHLLKRAALFLKLVVLISTWASNDDNLICANFFE